MPVRWHPLNSLLPVMVTPPRWCRSSFFGTSRTFRLLMMRAICISIAIDRSSRSGRSCDRRSGCKINRFPRPRLGTRSEFTAHGNRAFARLNCRSLGWPRFTRVASFGRRSSNVARLKIADDRMTLNWNTNCTSLSDARACAGPV